jgi:hypothetical protein
MARRSRLKTHCRLGSAANDPGIQSEQPDCKSVDKAIGRVASSNVFASLISAKRRGGNLSPQRDASYAARYDTRRFGIFRGEQNGIETGSKEDR